MIAARYNKLRSFRSLSLLLSRLSIVRQIMVIFIMMRRSMLIYAHVASMMESMTAHVVKQHYVMGNIVAQLVVPFLNLFGTSLHL